MCPPTIMEETTGTAPAPEAHRNALIGSTVCFAFAVCYLRFFVLPNVPILPTGDAIEFVIDGARIVAGQLPYRDFFEMLPPERLLLTHC
jgi:hypothetical protein